MTIIRRHKNSPHWLVVEIDNTGEGLLGRYLSKGEAEEHL